MRYVILLLIFMRLYITFTCNTNGIHSVNVYTNIFTVARGKNGGGGKMRLFGKWGLWPPPDSGASDYMAPFLSQRLL